MHYRLAIKWRFIRELIENHGLVAAIVIVALVVALYELFSGGIVSDLIRPVTNRLSGLLRKMDHSVKQYPDDTANWYPKKYSEEDLDRRVAEREEAIRKEQERLDSQTERGKK